MIEYLKFAGVVIVASITAIIFGLLFFKIIDIAVYMANKLGELMFGKEK